MPRRSRILSITGVYHIMLRGNEKKDIFLDDKDKSRIIDTIILKRKDGNFELFAFCVMNNHLHLLIKEGKDNIARIIKRIATSYAYYYNKKNKRVGHVFQDRYKSEAIRDDRQLLEVIRYIHNNPVKAGIVKKSSEYRWSSYSDYIAKIQLNKDSEVYYQDLTEILEMFSNNLGKAIKSFSEFNNERTEEKFVDIENPDEEKEEPENQISKLLNSKGIELADIKTDKSLRDLIIKELKFQLRIPGRQIAKLLDINRNIVQRIKE